MNFILEIWENHGLAVWISVMAGFAVFGLIQARRERRAARGGK